MIDELARMVQIYPRLVVLTGAGLSAESGIPTYRDDRGEWQRSDPILHQEFISDPAMRQRYWARSMNGWPYVRDARANPAHHGLARLEQLGHVALLVTQNVDRLHQQAGNRSVIDLHGRLDRVRCRACDAVLGRDALQRELEALNPGYTSHRAAIRPDGDAEVADHWVTGFRVPDCAACGGMLMPDVVFFGGSVPRPRVDRIQEALARADALLVVGSSLTVYSGFRFCRQAEAAGKPLFIINRGTTRADAMARLKLEMEAGPALAGLLERLRERTGFATGSLAALP
jgi:NAD-dependent SIR2 family protein deacetylase